MAEVHTQSPAPEGDADIRGLYPDTIAIDEDDRFNLRMGVYYPSGYAVLALAADAVQSAVAQSLQSGIARDDITLLEPSQMQQIITASREKAGMAARLVGAELKQLEVFDQLCESGHHFMLVRADDANRDAVLDLGMRTGAAKGLLYHSLAAEDIKVPRETIPEQSPFGANEVARTYESDASHEDKAGPQAGNVGQAPAGPGTGGGSGPR